MEELNITELSAGLVVPNYRRMCELLGDRVRTGEAKACQLRRWGELFSYEREGNKYRILEVAECLPEKTPRTRKGKYIQYVEPVLIDYICRNGGENRRISLTGKELFFLLGFVNDHYLASGKVGEIYGDISGFEIDENVTDDLMTEDGTKFKCGDMYWFRTKTGKRLNNILRSALRSMQKRRTIDLDYEYAITMLGKDGNARTRIATERQIEIIRTVEEDILKEMGVFSVKVIYSTNRTREFFDHMNKILTAEYGWKRVVRKTVIVLNEKYTVGGKLRKSEVRHFKRVLNRTILEYLSKEAEVDKAVYDSGEYLYNPNSWRSKVLNEVLERDDFLETQKSIADYLIKI